MLVIFAGLPGSGKSTIARVLCESLGAFYLRVDSMEQAMRGGGISDDQIGGSGYAVAQRVALDNLRLGRIVVIDSVNPWELTREAYRDVARAAGTHFLDVEVVCSDVSMHRQRVEERESDIPGHVLPTWELVLDRDYHDWHQLPLRIDTARLSISEAVSTIQAEISRTCSA